MATVDPTEPQALSTVGQQLLDGGVYLKFIWAQFWLAKREAASRSRPAGAKHVPRPWKAERIAASGCSLSPSSSSTAKM